jgi:hypothetical protein
MNEFYACAYSRREPDPPDGEDKKENMRLHARFISRKPTLSFMFAASSKIVVMLSDSFYYKASSLKKEPTINGYH